MEVGTFSPPTQRWLESGRHIEVADKQVFVVERGAGPVILFIHGFPTSGHDWDAVTRDLSDQFRCISIDLPGFGLSDKPAAYSYSLFQQADVVEELLSKMQVERAHVVSHDMGTSVHTELLARTLEGRLTFTIETSTFLNGSMIKNMASLTAFQELLEPPSRVPEAMEVCKQLGPTYVPALKNLMAKPEVVSDDDATIMTELLLYQDGHLRIPGVYSYVRERYLHMDRWLGALEATESPIQIIWGTADPVAVEAMGDALAARLPRAKYTKVPDVGHFLPVEAPDIVADLVRSFVTT